VTSSGFAYGDPLTSQPFSGSYILEVPFQIRPIPPEVLEHAQENNVTIRDDFGNVYTSAKANVCCCSDKQAVHSE
jgi:hypothetical protein